MATRSYYGVSNNTSGNGATTATTTTAASGVMPQSISISTVVPANASSLHRAAEASTSSSANAQHGAKGKNGHAAGTAAAPQAAAATPTSASGTYTRAALAGDTSLSSRDNSSGLRNDASGDRAARQGSAGARHQQQQQQQQHRHQQQTSAVGGSARRSADTADDQDDVDGRTSGYVERASDLADVDAAARSGGGTNELLEYCGVRLLPGVEEIAFDEGYYVGTMDEDGEMAGYGKATWHSGDTYEGEWLDGVMHGKGTYTWADGDYYSGSYVHGRMEGYGEMKDATGVYVGEWVDDMRQGYGRMEYEGGNVYEGDWLAGMRHGSGKLVEPSAQVTYEGEFTRNEKEGRGVQTNADGDVYDGDFARGKPNGRGTYLWADGARYIGMFKDGVKHGDGCEWLANGDWIAGLFVQGEHVDNQSTRHKATVLSGADDNNNDGEHTGDADGGAAGHLGSNLSDTTAAAVLAPLDADKLLRLTLEAASPSFSTSATVSARVGRGTVGRNSTASAGGGAAAAAAASAAGTLNTTIGSRRTSRQQNSLRHRDPTSSISASSGALAPKHDAAASAVGANTAAGSSSGDDVASPFTSALAAPVMLLDDSDLEGWTQLKTIGKGSFGAVCTVLLRNGRTVCCKVIELGSVENEEEMEKLRGEIALMKRLRHPNCVQYYGSLEDKVKNTLNIFMEYVSGGTLTSFVTKFNSIPLTTLRQWAYQMVCGVRYLHECGIVHRDIKGDNVLVSVDGIVKLADFGCSKAIDDVCSATHGCSTMVGTPYWMAPEVIKCEAGGYGMKSDIWSVGCTMVEMLTGKPPWPECNSMWAAVYKIANSTGLPTEIPADVDPELMDLLSKCFERNPKMRPTAAEMLKHPFLAKALESPGSSTAASSPKEGSRRH